MSDLLLNSVGKNICKNYPSQGSNIYPLAPLSTGQGWPPVTLTPLLLGCDIGRWGSLDDQRHVAATEAGIGGEGERVVSGA